MEVVYTDCVRLTELVELVELVEVLDCLHRASLHSMARTGLTELVAIFETATGLNINIYNRHQVARGGGESGIWLGKG